MTELDTAYNQVIHVVSQQRPLTDSLTMKTLNSIRIRKGFYPMDFLTTSRLLHKQLEFMLNVMGWDSHKVMTANLTVCIGLESNGLERSTSV